jgi:hypothetical protein
MSLTAEMKTVLAVSATVACALVAVAPGVAAPTKRPPPLTPVAHDALTRALARGRLTEARYSLQRARSLFALGAVRQEFGQVAKPSLRDATPILRDLAARLPRLSAADRASARAILSRPTDKFYDDEHHYRSSAIVATKCDTTRPLCFHWDERATNRDSPPGADGNVSTIPADVAATVATFAGVYDLEVGSYEFQAPLPDTSSPGQSSSPETDIYLADLGRDPNPSFGYCTTDDPHAFDQGYLYYDVSAYCVVDEDFTNAVYGGIDPVDARAVTAAHEFFHAIQFGYDWLEDLWLMEGTAMLMEGQFRPTVKDRIRYLDDSALTSPSTPVDLGDGGFEYGAWIWWRFLVEELGELPNPLVIRQIWEHADGSSDTDGGGPDTVGRDDYSLQAARHVVAARGSSFRALFGKFARVNRTPARFYSEGGLYPRAPLSHTHFLGRGRRGTDWQSTRLRHLASRYFAFKPGSSASSHGSLRVRVDLPRRWRGPEAYLLVRRTSGSWYVRKFALDSDGDGVRSVAFGRGTIREVNLVLTNASTTMRCWRATFYSCAGVGADDLRYYKFRATVR